MDCLYCGRPGERRSVVTARLENPVLCDNCFNLILVPGPSLASADEQRRAAVQSVLSLLAGGAATSRDGCQWCSRDGGTVNTMVRTPEWSLERPVLCAACAALLGLSRPSPGDLGLSPEEVAEILDTEESSFVGDPYAREEDADFWELDERAVWLGMEAAEKRIFRERMLKS